MKTCSVTITSVLACLVFLASFRPPCQQEVGMGSNPTIIGEHLSLGKFSGENRGLQETATKPENDWSATGVLGNSEAEGDKESHGNPLPAKERNGEQRVDPLAKPSRTRIAQKYALSPYSKDEIMEQLKQQALQLGLEPRLAISMAEVESGYNPNAISPKGAIGVLQIMPKVAWKDFKVSREMLFDPETNIRVGLSWLKSLLNRFDQDLDLSLAAYNAGASRVVKAGYQIPHIEETQAYVRNVRKIMEE